MEIIFLLIFIRVIVVDSLPPFRQHHLCPVSSTFDTRTDGRFSYPAEVFYESGFVANNAVASLLEDGNVELFNCSAIEKLHRKKVYKCPDSLLNCPLELSDLNEAVSRSNAWLPKDSFCRFRKRLRSLDTNVNVIILGGSVTWGRETSGCCCTPSLNPRCKSELFPDCSAALMDHTVCRWPWLYSRWLRSVRSASVTLIDLSKRGVASPYMVDLLYYELSARGIHSLNSSDLILIDHSINDAIQYGKSDFELTELHHGLEELGLKIIGLSAPKDWPSVVLLETWPFPSHEIHKWNNSLDYSSVYSAVAKEFQWPIWSFRDLVVHLRQTKPLNSALRAALSFENNLDQHPPWYLHLYWADLLAGLTLLQFDKCFLAGGSSASSRQTKNMNSSVIPSLRFAGLGAKRCGGGGVGMENVYITAEREAIGFITSTTMATEPESMIAADDNSGRRGGWSSQASVPTSTSLLRRPNSTNSTLPPPLPAWTISSSPSTSWALTEDRKDKFGWISSLSTGGGQRPSLTFTIRVKLDSAANSSYVLSVEFLRTYFNAGTVDVAVCGIKVVHLDALWPDFTTSRVSLVQTKRNRLENSVVKSCASAGLVKVVFKHALVYNRSMSHSSSPDFRARDDEKFKLVAVKLCSETRQA